MGTEKSLFLGLSILDYLLRVLEQCRVVRGFTGTEMYWEWLAWFQRVILTWGWFLFYETG